jgi:glutaredoxin
MKNLYTYSIAVLITILILFVGYYLVSQNNKPKEKPTKTNEVILFFGNTCPHCKNVEEFLTKNKNIEEKIIITKKEVYENKINAQDLENKALICGEDTSSGVPVPFLYFKGECTIGDNPIINFLTEKAK